MPRTTRNSQQAEFEEAFTLLDPSGNLTPTTRSATHPPTPAPMSTPQQAPVHISLETPKPLSEAQQFAKAVGELIKTGDSSKPKLREPDPVTYPSRTSPTHPPMDPNFVRAPIE